MTRDVVFWFPAVDPYYVERFEALHQAGTLNFECWYTRESTRGRAWKVDTKGLSYPHRFVRSLGRGHYRTGVPLFEWIAARPKVLITLHGHPSVAAANLHSLVPKSILAFYGEMTFPRMVRKTRTKEFLKHVLLSRSDAVLTPGRASEDYFRPYLAGDKPIYRLNHVIDQGRFREALRLRSSARIQAIKAELGLSGFTFLYVGKVSFHKGIDILLAAFEEVQASGYDCSLLIVGEGEERSQFVALTHSKGLDCVRFHDFVQQDNINEFYAMGDAFVFASRSDSYGLVIDEAMAAGLPVITTSSVGDIADRVDQDRTGYIIPPEDVPSMTEAMIRLLQDHEGARKMGMEGHLTCPDRTPEFWAQQVTSIVNELLTPRL